MMCRGSRIRALLAALAALFALAVALPPTSGAQSALTVTLAEDPFVCDSVVRGLGTVSGFIAGETVEFSSPELAGVFSVRTADALGQVAMRWNCSAPQTWTVSVRGVASSTSATFVVTGIAAPPPPTAPVGAAFDAKSAMTAEQMAIWKDFSPYSTVGIYIPVDSDWDNRADKIQRNLTAPWVETILADGWSIIPIYVGRQAPRPCQTARFEGLSNDPTTARDQGFEAAADAVNSASRLGIGVGQPIYYDMEAYRPGCAEAVLAFLDAWTEGLHVAGYVSGVYGSRSSTMWDLSRSLGRGGFDAPDAVWVSTGNGRAGSLGLEVPNDGQWTNARIHQYRLSITRTYGGVTREVDENIVDAPLATASAPAPVVVDSDGDGVGEPEPDNCDSIANPDQADLDNDGDGDVCDIDIDGDGTPNDTDPAPTDPSIVAPTAAPEPTAVPAATAAAEPASPTATVEPSPTAEPAQVVIIPTPTIAPSPSPTPTAIASATAVAGADQTRDDDVADLAAVEPEGMVTLMIEQDSSVLPYAIAGLALFSIFCAAMGIRSFLRSRELAPL